METKREESIEWHDRDNATVTIVDNKEFKGSTGKDKNKNLGTQETKSVLHATYDDFVAGLKIMEDKMLSNAKKLEVINNKLKALGKQKILTNEQHRLKKNLEILHKEQQRKELSEQGKPIMAEIESGNKAIEIREKHLKSRPSE